MPGIVEALELFAAGVTVASTGALLAIIYIIFSPALDKEVRTDSSQRPC